LEGAVGEERDTQIPMNPVDMQALRQSLLAREFEKASDPKWIREKLEVCAKYRRTEFFSSGVLHGHYDPKDKMFLDFRSKIIRDFSMISDVSLVPFFSNGYQVRFVLKPWF
jgi:hypothetical protein